MLPSCYYSYNNDLDQSSELSVTNSLRIGQLFFPWTGTLARLALYNTPTHSYNDRMPTCTCGCNQELTRRAIKKHLQGQTAPRLVSAVVRACQTIGSAVSPPRLNLSKKLRSSRRYFPSSPVPAAANEEPDAVVSEGGDAARGIGMSEEYDEDFVDGAQHAINAALEDVWSGLHHHDDNTEEEHNENDEDEGEDVEEDPDGWKLYDSWDHSHEGDLSALDTLGEDFERDAVANGEFLCGSARASTYSST